MWCRFFYLFILKMQIRPSGLFRTVCIFVASFECSHSIGCSSCDASIHHFSLEWNISANQYRHVWCKLLNLVRISPYVIHISHPAVVLLPIRAAVSDWSWLVFKDSFTYIFTSLWMTIIFSAYVYVLQYFGHLRLCHHHGVDIFGLV